jgi:hypothetical protein
MRINLTRSAAVAFAVFVVVLAMAVPSHATGTDVVYTGAAGQTAFNTTVGPSQTTIDFTGPTTQFTSPYTNSGVTFTGQSGRDVEIIDGTNVGFGAGEFVLSTYCQVSGPGCNLNQSSVPNLELFLPAGTTAIGFDIADANSGAPSGAQDTYLLTDSNGSTITVTPTAFGSFTFVGFSIGGTNTSIGSVTIERLTITPNGEPVIDNAQFAPPAPTPEPSTLSLAGMGLLTAGGFLRRRLGREKR